MDVMDVYTKTKAAVDRARSGQGPTLLECKTYRYMGHSRFEKPTYRTQQELDEWKAKDPIPGFASTLKTQYGVSEDQLSFIESQVDQEIENAVSFAEQSPDPEPLDYQGYIYA